MKCFFSFFSFSGCEDDILTHWQDKDSVLLDSLLAATQYPLSFFSYKNLQFCLRQQCIHVKDHFFFFFSASFAARHGHVTKFWQ